MAEEEAEAPATLLCRVSNDEKKLEKLSTHGAAKQGKVHPPNLCLRLIQVVRTNHVFART